MNMNRAAVCVSRAGAIPRQYLLHRHAVANKKEIKGNINPFHLYQFRKCIFYHFNFLADCRRGEQEREQREKDRKREEARQRERERARKTHAATQRFICRTNPRSDLLLLPYESTSRQRCSHLISGSCTSIRVSNGTPRRQSAMSSSPAVGQPTSSPILVLRSFGSCTEAQGLSAEPLDNTTR